GAPAGRWGRGHFLLLSWLVHGGVLAGSNATSREPSRLHHLIRTQRGSRSLKWNGCPVSPVLPFAGGARRLERCRWLYQRRGRGRGRGERDGEGQGRSAPPSAHRGVPSHHECHLGRGAGSGRQMLRRARSGRRKPLRRASVGGRACKTPGSGGILHDRGSLQGGGGKTRTGESRGCRETADRRGTSHHIRSQPPRGPMRSLLLSAALVPGQMPPLGPVSDEGLRCADDALPVVRPSTAVLPVIGSAPINLTVTAPPAATPAVEEKA